MCFKNTIQVLACLYELLYDSNIETRNVLENTMNATATIISKLQEIFAPMDDEVLVGTKAWAAGRALAVREFKLSDEGKSLSCDAHRYYARLHTIAGGKTWYQAFNGRSLCDIEEVVEKHCAAVAKKRNASISAKLAKAGVNEVVSEEFHRTADGFNGLFVVGTDAGVKSVRIETIKAGGYNIQCLHLRVLVSVK